MIFEHVTVGGCQSYLIGRHPQRTLAAATLRELGFMRATALDGGVKAWREAGYSAEG